MGTRAGRHRAFAVVAGLPRVPRVVVVGVALLLLVLLVAAGAELTTGADPAQAGHTKYCGYGTKYLTNWRRLRFLRHVESYTRHLVAHEEFRPGIGAYGSWVIVHKHRYYCGHYHT